MFCGMLGSEGSTFSLRSILPLRKRVTRRKNDRIEKMKRPHAANVYFDAMLCGAGSPVLLVFGALTVCCDVCGGVVSVASVLEHEILVSIVAILLVVLAATAMATVRWWRWRYGCEKKCSRELESCK